MIVVRLQPHEVVRNATCLGLSGPSLHVTFLRTQRERQNFSGGERVHVCVCAHTGWCTAGAGP